MKQEISRNRYEYIFLGPNGNLTSVAATTQPWLTIDETNLATSAPLTVLMPATVEATSFSGNINIQGTLDLMPAPNGNLELAAANSIEGFQPTSSNWTEALIDVSDADPTLIRSIADPLGVQNAARTVANDLVSVDAVFNESGSIEGAFGTVEVQETLHDKGLLHADDQTPLGLYADSGAFPASPSFPQSSPKSSPAPI